MAETAPQPPGSAASRAAVLAYGTLTYVLFLGVFLYAIGFVGGVAVPRGIDDGAVTSPGTALLINLALLGLFGIQHSIMARPWFKQWWTKIIPQPIERSTFVLFTNLILMLMFWQWRALPEVVWAVQGVGAAVLLGLFALGWLMVLVATFLIDHFDLFGLRQVVLHWRGIPYTNPVFQERSLYRWVRHPLLLGFLIAFWSAPVMTQGRLLFCVVTTAYMLVAIQLEERDLLKAHGDDYREYRSRVSMLLPLRRRVP